MHISLPRKVCLIYFLIKLYLDIRFVEEKKERKGRRKQKREKERERDRKKERERERKINLLLRTKSRLSRNLELHDVNDTIVKED